MSEITERPMTLRAEDVVWDDDPANKLFNPLEHRGSHGEWESGGSSAEHVLSSSHVVTPKNKPPSNIEIGNHTIDLSHLTNINPKLAQEVSERVQAFSDQYPHAASTLIKVTSSDFPSRTIAKTISGPGGSIIFLNEKYYQHPRQFATALNEMYDSGWHPLASTQSIIDHELGHVLDDAYEKSNEWSRSMDDAWTDADSLRQLSGYSADSNREGFAEGFAVLQDHISNNSDTAWDKLPTPMMKSLSLIKDVNSA